MTSVYFETLTLSVRGGLSKGTLKTTIEVATFDLCNFSTIHSHGSILGSFESQEPQLPFWRPQICIVHCACACAICIVRLIRKPRASLTKF